MALRGTLKDFGIADVFQLIGHQGKNGRLTVSNKEHQVDLFFSDGNIARAQAVNRDKRDRLGAMLVRAEVISQENLDSVLEIQANGGGRLGDILVQREFVDRDSLNTFAKLQTTETIYRLFLWGNGTYEFEALEVPVAPDAHVIRSETVLMEGFRQVDEWPAVRKRLSGYGMIFRTLENLEEMLAQDAASGGGDDMLGLDDAFGDFDLGGPTSNNPRLRNIGEHERLVFELIADDRDVQKIIDLSRLGEFETCKAFANLLEATLIEERPELEQKAPSADATVGGITQQSNTGMRMVVRAALVVGAISGALLVWTSVKGNLDSLVLGVRTSSLIQDDVKEVLSRANKARIRRAIELYRAEMGHYPEGLGELVDHGLITDSLIRYPWGVPYAYRIEDNGITKRYVLLRPLD